MNARENWVDYAKGIGIILVVYGHVARGIYNSGIYIPQAWYEWADSIIYTFHMPLFFFLSGLFFYQSFYKKGAGALVFNKIDTILYPYVLWSILQGVSEVFLSSYTNGNVSYAEVFSLFMEPRAQFWFLYALFFIFILVALFFHFFPKKASWTLLVVSLFAHFCISFFYFGLVVNSVFYNLIFFSLGILFSLHVSIKHISNKKSLLLLLVLFVFGQYGYHVFFDGSTLVEKLLLFCLTILSLLLVLVASYQCSLKQNRWLLFVGSSSMAIYVMHVFAGSGIRVVLYKFLGVDSYLVHIVAGCVVGIFAPLLALVVINRYHIPYLFSAPISKMTNLFANRK